MNYRSFEDRKRTLEEIKFLFFNTLYRWTATFISLLVISYHDFLVPFALARCVFFFFFFCILLVYMGAPYTFNDILITYKKKLFGA
jgi:hypothetical protein